MKNTTKNIGINGIIIPFIGALVSTFTGFFVQKALIKREQNKAIDSQQDNDSIIVNVDEEFKN